MSVIRAIFKPGFKVNPLKVSSSGFTLIEMMVAIAINGLMGGATVISLNTYRQKTSIQQAAFEIAGEFYSLKGRAIRERQNCTINFDNALHTFTVNDPNPNPVVNLSDYPGTITFTANPEAADDFTPAISFDFRGFSTDLVNSAQVYVQGTDSAGNVQRIYRIQVLPVGAVSVRYWDPVNITWAQ